MLKDSSAPRCAGIPHEDSAELTQELQECIKEQIIPTPLVPLFERARTSVLPLVSAHKVEKKMNHICISKEKVKVCGGMTVASSTDMMKTKTVEYACVSSPSSKAKSMEQRAKAGESLGIELGVLSTAYTKEEAEPKYCATGATGRMGMGPSSRGYGPNGSQGGYGMGASGINGFGHGGGQEGYGNGASGSNGFGPSVSQGGYDFGGSGSNGYGPSGSQGGNGMGGSGSNEFGGAPLGTTPATLCNGGQTSCRNDEICCQVDSTRGSIHFCCRKPVASCPNHPWSSHMCRWVPRESSNGSW